jgi:hypothetical protein
MTTTPNLTMLNCRIIRHLSIALLPANDDPVTVQDEVRLEPRDILEALEELVDFVYLVCHAA